jgi:hypothetical protein
MLIGAVKRHANRQGGFRFPWWDAGESPLVTRPLTIYSTLIANPIELCPLTHTKLWRISLIPLSQTSTSTEPIYAPLLREDDPQRIMMSVHLHRICEQELTYLTEMGTLFFDSSPLPLARRSRSRTTPSPSFLLPEVCCSRHMGVSHKRQFYFRSSSTCS